MSAMLARIVATRAIGHTKYDNVVSEWAQENHIRILKLWGEMRVDEHYRIVLAKLEASKV